MDRRAKWAGIILSVLVVVAVASMVATSLQGVSASQAAANATPPAAGPTSAPVERRSLSESLSIRGAITAPTAVTVTGPAAVSEASRPLVTNLQVQPGAVVNTPAVVAEVAGRPIIVVHSATPFYRDLLFGDKGNDVSALQAALGLKETGVFDAGTQNGLAELYEELGYSAPDNETLDAETDGDLVRGLQDALDDAKTAGELQVVQAQAALRDVQAQSAAGAATESDVEQAQTQLKIAQSARDTAVARAQRDLASARTRAQQAALLAGSRFEVDEITAVPFPSTTVLTVDAGLGQELQPSQQMLTLGDPVLKAITFVDLASAQTLKAGMRVSVTGSTLPSSLEGRVTAVAADPSNVAGGDQAAPAGVTGSSPTQERPYEVEVDLTSQPPSTSVGSGVLLTVTVDGTEASVLSVPAVALQRVDGKDVVVSLPDRKQWEVEPGFTAEGWVELRRGSPPVGTLVETR